MGRSPKQTEDTKGGEPSTFEERLWKAFFALLLAFAAWLWVAGG